MLNIMGGMLEQYAYPAITFEMHRLEQIVANPRIRFQMMLSRLALDHFMYDTRTEEVDRQWSAHHSARRKHWEESAMIGRCPTCLYQVTARQIKTLPSSILEAKADGRFPNEGMCDRCIFGEVYDVA